MDGERPPKHYHPHPPDIVWQPIFQQPALLITNNASFKANGVVYFPKDEPRPRSRPARQRGQWHRG